MHIYNNLHLSIHALERAQERGFKKEVVEFLIFFGEFVLCGSDCIEVFITKKSLRSLLNSKRTSQKIKSFIKKNFDKLSRKRVVVGEGVIVTCFNKRGKQ